MEPRNDHEREVAKAIDYRFLIDPGIHYVTIVPEIAQSLDFMLSASDTEFLIDYPQWRMSHSAGN